MPFVPNTCCCNIILLISIYEGIIVELDTINSQTAWNMVICLYVRTYVSEIIYNIMYMLKGILHFNALLMFAVIHSNSIRSSIYNQFN